MRLNRRSFFKALGGGVVAALLPKSLFGKPDRELKFVDGSKITFRDNGEEPFEGSTDDTIWMLPEDARVYNEMIAKDSRADCEEGIY